MKNIAISALPGDLIMFAKKEESFFEKINRIP